ncbi:MULTISPECIES: hypothetical protein [Helicobacter]|uniref:Uncharacterized protein n=2 Tax=Helicobacter ganmani TaxID=60246 RepID=A0A3D8ICT5_9HELI|nr:MULTISPECIES: hypothetical protein [Helicobacter]RDU62969.1 hypothetical protein CQA43_04905 [Helicobacter ganmani]
MWRILLGIVYLTAFCEASEYIFSYRVAARNGMLLNEKYYFSPAMVGANILRQTKNPYKKCTISHEAKTEKALLRDYKEKILECFLKWGVRLEDNTQVQNLQGKSITYLAIPPTRIQIEYADGIATIYALTHDINKTIKAIKE